MLTFIEVSIILCMLRKREAVGDFKSVFHHQPQQHTLDDFIALALFLIMFDDLQHHLKYIFLIRVTWNVLPHFGRGGISRTMTWKSLFKYSQRISVLKS